MSSRDLMEISISAIGGMAVGAALMYLFDPETGATRREYVAETASDALSTATETVSEKAKELGHYVSNMTAGATGSEVAADYADRARDAAGSLAESAHAVISRLGAKSSQRARDWSDTGRGYLSRARAVVRPEPEGFSTTTTALSAFGALALGVGAMWLLDPARGRSRRAWLLQKANRVVNETGDFARRTGRHLRNKAVGYAHEAGSLASGVSPLSRDQVDDRTLAERVRSALGRLGTSSSSLGIDVAGGVVILAGRVDPNMSNEIEAACRSVRGVTEVRFDRIPRNPEAQSTEARTGTTTSNQASLPPEAFNPSLGT